MSFEINATARSVQGTGASRRLRRAGRTPAVVYGAGQDAVAIELDHNDVFYKLRNEAFHSSVLSLSVEGKAEKVVLRSAQFHPFKPLVLHVDFQRVAEDQAIKVKVPFHFINGEISPGVKLNGCIVARLMTEAEVSCLPSQLPEFIEVDLGHLEKDQAIHLSEVTLPEGVSFVSLGRNEDLAIAAVRK